MLNAYVQQTIIRDATNAKKMSFFLYDKSLYAMMTNLQVDIIICHVNLYSDISKWSCMSSW